MSATKEAMDCKPLYGESALVVGSMPPSVPYRATCRQGTPASADTSCVVILYTPAVATGILYHRPVASTEWVASVCAAAPVASRATAMASISFFPLSIIPITDFLSFYCMKGEKNNLYPTFVIHVPRAIPTLPATGHEGGRKVPSESGKKCVRKGRNFRKTASKRLKNQTKSRLC